MATKEEINANPLLDLPKAERAALAERRDPAYLAFQEEVYRSPANKSFTPFRMPDDKGGKEEPAKAPVEEGGEEPAKTPDEEDEEKKPVKVPDGEDEAEPIGTTMTERFPAEIWVENFRTSFVNYEKNNEKKTAFTTYLYGLMRMSQKSFEGTESAAKNRAALLTKKQYKLLKDIRKTIRDYGYTEAEVFADSSACGEIAAACNTRAETVLRLIGIDRPTVSLQKKIGGEDDDERTVGDTILDKAPDFTLELEGRAAVGLALLLARMFDCQPQTLEAQEEYAKKYGYVWSNVILRHVRCIREDSTDSDKKDKKRREKAIEAAGPEEREAACYDYADLEDAGKLWDVLLMHDYTDFLIQGPAQTLYDAALNALVDPKVYPSGVALATFRGCSKSDVTQKENDWAQHAVLLLLRKQIYTPKTVAQRCLKAGTKGRRHKIAQAVKLYAKEVENSLAAQEKALEKECRAEKCAETKRLKERELAEKTRKWERLKEKNNAVIKELTKSLAAVDAAEKGARGKA